MSERRYQGSIGKQEAVQREMADWDMSSPEEFREALAGETKLPETAMPSIDEDVHGERPEKVIPDWRTFTPVLHHIEGAFRNPDLQKAEQYRTAEDPLDRLRIIREMSPSDAVAAIWNFSENDARKRYVASRLEFYQKLFQGTATKKVKESASQYDEKTQQWVSVETTREELIDNADVTPDTIKVGLLRDMMFGEMIGTPELGIYKLAQKFAKTKGFATTHLPPLKGYHSDIHYGGRGGIGNYEFLRKLYGQAQRSVNRKVTGDSDLEKVEHKSVLTAARWLADAMDYNPSSRGPESPYCASIEEAVAWAQLGDSVKRQLRGMRQKIQGVDLHNIGRFIGKSGDTRYDAERGRLRYEIRALQADEWQMGAAEKKERIIEQHSQDVTGDFSKQREEFGQLKQRLSAIEDSEISGTNLQREVETIFVEYGRLLEAASLEDKTGLDLVAVPTGDEQKSLVAEYQKKQKALERRYKTKAHNAEAAGQTIDFSEQLEGDRARLEAWKSRQEEILPFRARLEELDEKIEMITERLDAAGTASLPELVQKKLEARLAEVNERYEKRKSLAAKALDLHFQFNHEGKQYGSKPFSGIVDWVNYAPLGAIKRTHRMLRAGMGEKEIIAYAAAEIIAGKRGVTRADIRAVDTRLNQLGSGGHNGKEQLASMVKVGNILSRFGYEVPFDDVEQMAKQNFYGMTDVLKMYDLEQARLFMNAGSDLRAVAVARKTTQEFGIEVEPIVIAEMAKHDLTGLEKAMRTFNFNDVLTLLKDDVKLPIAVGVLKHTTSVGHNLDTAQISALAKKIIDLDDFVSSLAGLSLHESEALLQKGIRFQIFEQVKSALTDHELDAGFPAVVDIVEVLLVRHEYDQLEPALEHYSIEQIKEIASNGIPLRNQLEVVEALKKGGVSVSFRDQIVFAKFAGEWSCGDRISEAIEIFGIENALKIVDRGVYLEKAIEAKKYLTAGNNGAIRISPRSKDIRKQLDEAGIDVLIEVARAGDAQTAEKVIESGFELEEIIRFPFLISPLIETEKIL